MIEVSREFLEQVSGDNRNFLYYMDFVLANNSVLHLTNEHLWQGGLVIEDAVSSENALDVGSVIINQCTITLNNINEQFDNYDFNDARVTVSIGLMIPGETSSDPATIERFQKGIYTVDSVMNDGSLLTLTCLDDMTKLDAPFIAGNFTLPATIQTIVSRICSIRSLTDGIAYSLLPLRNMQITAFDFQSESITYRDIIAWAAQINGMNARINRQGAIEFLWYDRDTLGIDAALIGSAAEPEYLFVDSELQVDEVLETQDRVGILLNYPIFNNMHGIYSISAAKFDTVITGVKVIVRNNGADQTALTEYVVGTDEYMIVIDNNGFVTTDNAQTVAEAVATQVVGMQYRKANYSHIEYPTMEAGDIAFIYDGKGRLYRTLVSSTTFTAGDQQFTFSAGETPQINATSRYSESTKNFVKTKELTDKTFSTLQDRINNSSGLYTTEISDGQGGTIYYLHDKPQLSQSTNVWKMTSEAWGVSTDGGQTYRYGMTVDGDAVVRILQATGVNADWIDAGAFKIMDADGETVLFLADKTNHSFEWHMDKSELSTAGKLQLHSGSYNDGTEQAAGVAVDLLAEAQTAGYEEKAFLYANGMRFRNQHSTGGIEDYHYQTNIRPGSAYFENNEDGTHGTQIGGSGLSTTDDVSFGGSLYHNNANAGTSLELLSVINHLWQATMPRIVVPRATGQTHTVDVSRFKQGNVYAALIVMWSWTTSRNENLGVYVYGGIQNGYSGGNELQAVIPIKTGIINNNPSTEASIGSNGSSQLTLKFYDVNGGGYAILPLIYAADDQFGNLPYV